jgi:hypothetical protein
MFSFASWVIYVATGCRNPVIRYWKPSLAKTTVTCFQLHPENESQWSINSFRSSIYGNQCSVQIFLVTMVLLTTLIAKSAIYQRYITDSKVIAIAKCKHQEMYYLLLKQRF